jgi:hypothetical protein
MRAVIGERRSGGQANAAASAAYQGAAAIKAKAWGTG